MNPDKFIALIDGIVLQHKSLPREEYELKCRNLLSVVRREDFRDRLEKVGGEFFLSDEDAAQINEENRAAGRYGNMELGSRSKV